MQVVLLSFTPEPELVIASAAKLSASKVGAGELRERLSAEQVAGFLNMLISSGHFSPFEHASFTFAIDGISRAASHQLVRHRMASYTQQSQRYVSFQKMEYIPPPTVIAKGFKSKFDEVANATHELYREMIEAGVPVEDARYILPNAAETKIVMTMNARELLHACSLRLCMKAQWEIREMFNKVKQEVENVAPYLGGELKPKCYNLGYCDERESCGLFPTKEEVLKD
ncbi:MAG: FAD-dependent thymidylate synthase [Dehalococcoidia bacterium]